MRNFSRLFNFRDSVYRFKDFSNKAEHLGSRNQLLDGGVPDVHDYEQVLQGQVPILLHHHQANALAQAGPFSHLSFQTCA